MKRQKIKKEKERDKYHGVESSDWYLSTAVKKKKEELKNGKREEFEIMRVDNFWDLIKKTLIRKSGNPTNIYYEKFF